MHNISLGAQYVPAKQTCLTISPQAVEKLLAAVNLPSKKAKLKQLKEIIARSFDMKQFHIS